MLNYDDMMIHSMYFVCVCVIKIKTEESHRFILEVALEDLFLLCSFIVISK